MIIRKLFHFENANFVRTAESHYAPHLQAGSFKAEILLESDTFDNGQMVIDFGLMKHYFADITGVFNHSAVFCLDDENDYINFIKKHNTRWIAFPFNPTIEQFARIIFFLTQNFIDRIPYTNGEGGINVHSIIIHEGEETYVECTKIDVSNPRFGIIDPTKLILSPTLWENLTFHSLWKEILMSNK